MTLTVYTKPNCSLCKVTINKFRGAGLEVQIVDISEVPAAREYVVEELGYVQAPVVVYDRDGTENHWSGINAEMINRVISIETA